MNPSEIDVFVKRVFAGTDLGQHAGAWPRPSGPSSSRVGARPCLARRRASAGIPTQSHPAEPARQLAQESLKAHHCALCEFVNGVWTWESLMEK